MMSTIDRLKQSTKMKWFRLHKFKSKVNFHISVGEYDIKTAENPQELLEAFRLRHEVFNNEFRGIPGAGLDFDKFDYWFDHLIIIHRSSRRVIGTYRLHCSNSPLRSYSAQEFHLKTLKKFEGPYLELGRACIRKDFRKGSVISLLWRGIAQYMNLSGANLLFGCSSLKINNARDTALVFKRLRSLNVVEKDLMVPTRHFTMKDFNAWSTYFGQSLTEAQVNEADALIPSLLKTYLKLGAKIVAEPAFDQDFDCIDVLTVLKKEDLNDAVSEKFKIAR